MPKSKQQDFFQKHRGFGQHRYSHGGSASAGKRKIKRPLDTRRPIHIVMKSKVAREKLSLLGAKNQLMVKQTLEKRAQQFKIKLHGVENMGNHIHIVASFKRAQNMQDFLRTVAALIARQATGAKKGRPFGKRFWDALAFTRILAGRRGYATMQNYLKKNEIEREFGWMARQTVEEYERAEIVAQRRGGEVWKILESS